MAQAIDKFSEQEAVRKTIETYLAKSDLKAVKHVLADDAQIISVDARTGRIVQTPFTAKRRKPYPNETVVSPAQKIVAIDVAESSASAKVESEFPAVAELNVSPRKHVQYISLLKINGEWKIASILMPPLKFAEIVGEK